jgi:hypothetical protein
MWFLVVCNDGFDHPFDKYNKSAAESIMCLVPIFKLAHKKYKVAHVHFIKAYGVKRYSTIPS